nr:MAG TPA: hypothetical protein [Caudoviricetes sp.]
MSWSFLALLLFRCLRPYDVKPGMAWPVSGLNCDPAWCNRFFYS